MTDIFVVSDTHHSLWTEVHPDIQRMAAQADLVVHCGDFVRMDVVKGFKRQAKKAILVHGNSDPVELREALPYVETFEVDGVTFGAIHPAWGGPEFEPQLLLPDFTDPPQVILYGHIHEPLILERDGVLFVNPGQAYASFMVPATAACVTVENGKAIASIIEIEPAR